MKKMKFIAFTTGILLFFSTNIYANVTVDKMFGNNMVIQRDMPAPVWGKASPNEVVTVTIAGQSKSTTADAQGDFKVILDSLTAGGPFTLTVSGNNSVSFSNVMAGEVWFLSGQSNMGSNMNSYNTNVEAANTKNIRMMDYNGSYEWKEGTPENIKPFSAVGFFFGRKLLEELNVPIGLYRSYKDGSRVESWMTQQGVIDDPDLNTGDWIGNTWRSSAAAEFYDTLVAPTQPFAIRGVIWYQGESNAPVNTDVYKYESRFRSLIEGWRTDWGQGDFPFYFVQVANFKGYNASDDWAHIRESQRRALTLPSTAMAVTIDIGETNNIHPVNKHDVGLRLALPALVNVYKVLNEVYSGPLYQAMDVRNDAIYIQFQHVGSGLFSNQTSLAGFEIAGPDSVFKPAVAVIEGNEVKVSNSTITDPKIVRYAWANDPSVSLFNKEEFPGSPFITNVKTSDCNNELGGTASVDACGVCSGGNTGIVTNSSCTIDCNGDANGVAFLDACNICVEGNTGKSKIVSGIPEGYVFLGNEGDTKNLAAKSDVVYGHGCRFTYLYGVSGSIAINNATFGDPAPGQVKKAYYKTIDVVTSADEQTTGSDFNIYPNPVHGQLNIVGEFSNWTLTDSKGAFIKAGTEKVVDVEALRSGLYYINVDGQVRKIIKN